MPSIGASAFLVVNGQFVFFFAFFAFFASESTRYHTSTSSNLVLRVLLSVANQRKERNNECGTNKPDFYGWLGRKMIYYHGGI